MLGEMESSSDVHFTTDPIGSHPEPSMPNHNCEQYERRRPQWEGKSVGPQVSRGRDQKSPERHGNLPLIRSSFSPTLEPKVSQFHERIKSLLLVHGSAPNFY
jgi:hypothetical protein